MSGQPESIRPHESENVEDTPSNPRVPSPVPSDEEINPRPDKRDKAEKGEGENFNAAPKLAGRDPAKHVDVEGLVQRAEQPTDLVKEHMEGRTEDEGAQGLPAPAPVLCGPLLRYTTTTDEGKKWHGSVMLVVAGGEENVPDVKVTSGGGEAKNKKTIFEEKGRRWVRWNIEVPLEESGKEVKYEVVLKEGGKKVEREFFVPGAKESFNIMFHSCNGFCEGAEENYPGEGTALWHDVVRSHKEKPIHVMVGGGDQVYSDGVREPGGPLREWAEELSPRKKAAIPFPDELKEKVDEWYFNNHITWFSKPGFYQANSRIPQVNIWDDHDIIDGFGSYKDAWQRAPVFSGVGAVAWKYYMLFQQQINPFDEEDDPSFVRHDRTGPYIKQKGLSLYSNLGPDVAFFGLDCRTDRTRERICYGNTYDRMFERLEKEIVKDKHKHLILLLGVPISYPRLVFFERFLTSRMIAPFRILNKITLGAVKLGFFNQFDSNPELLDDLEDHWAAGLHKKERNALITRLQRFSFEKSVRITILSGDVHLAAVGRFYTKPKYNLKQENDFRYIVNVISSAITNAPPPTAVGIALDRRNKKHRLGKHCEENMMNIWEENVDETANRLNKTTMTSRNFAMITKVPASTSSTDGSTVPSAAPNKASNGKLDPEISGGAGNVAKAAAGVPLREGAPQGSKHAAGLTQIPDALNVQFHVEADKESREGQTVKYAFSIPALVLEKGVKHHQ